MAIVLQLIANPPYCACAEVELLEIALGVIINAGGGPETGWKGLRLLPCPTA